MTRSAYKHALTRTAAALALAGLLTACGGSSDQEADQDTTATAQEAGAAGSTAADSATAGEFNDADVLFVQMMIPHHQQALDMAKLAATNAAREEVKKLAADIEAAQGPEIEKMRGWLKDWGRTESDGAMAGMDHSTEGHAGMMPQAHLDDMGKLTGTEFEKMFLEMMIDHHQGAIDAAKTAQAEGKNPDVKALAAQVEADQSAEIERIKKLLEP